MKSTYRLPSHLYGLMLLIGVLSLALSTNTTGRAPLADPLVLTQPTYNCGTGTITFNTTGGDGSTITYTAPGIIRSSLTSNTGTVEQGLRNDPKPITITAMQRGQTIIYTFDLKATCSSTTPGLPSPIAATVPDQLVRLNQSLTYPAIEISSNQYNPAVSDDYTAWAISAQGLPPGLRLSTSVLMKTFFLVSINGKATQVGIYPVTVKAVNTRAPQDPPFITTFTITVVDNSADNVFALLAPTYNCVTGAITFNTTGGDGTPITYFAPGITGPTINPNQFVDAGLRQAADAKPISLSATQSGVTVTYTFDLRATCPIGTTPPTQASNDRAILVELFNSTNGPSWTNKTNWLQGDSPCGWFGVRCDGNGRVTELQLFGNKLVGTIPVSLGNLPFLTILSLYNNQLSGPIPASLGNLTQLVSLFLSNNQLNGSIPNSLGSLSKLMDLQLNDNQLSGTIPASLGNLPVLRGLLLQYNQLSGCFPVELASLCGKSIITSNNPGLPGGGDFASFCSNRTGACTTTPTMGNLALTAPTYDCDTGAITFNTTGGDGSTITYQAPGIIRSSLTSNNGTVEQGLRNDPKPITIQATQSGQTTSYLFDLKAFCTRDDIRLYGVDTTFFAGSFDYKVGEGTYDPSNPIDRWSKTVTSSLPELYFNYRLQDDKKTYTLHIFGQKDNRAGSFPITITIVNPRYPNQPITNRFTLTFKKYGPEPGNLTLTAPTYNCTTGAITFNTTGGNGTLIEYQAPGITGWTTNPNQFVDKDSRTASDVQPFTLMARQSGIVVTYTWDLKQACGRARVAATESTLNLHLLGNPVHESVQVLIKGAGGQPVQLRLADERGHLLESRTIEQAGAEEVQQFKLDPSAGPGILFLQATQQQQVRTVKILQQ